MEKRRSPWIVALGLSGLLLAGCGNEGESNDVETSFDQQATNEREPGTSAPDENTEEDDQAAAEESSGVLSAGSASGTTGADNGEPGTSGVDTSSGSRGEGESGLAREGQRAESAEASEPGAYSESRPERESPTPSDVESGTNINTGVGNEGAPEPSNEPSKSSQ